MLPETGFSINVYLPSESCFVCSENLSFWFCCQPYLCDRNIKLQPIFCVKEGSKQASQQACIPSQAWKHLPLLPTFPWQMELGRNKIKTEFETSLGYMRCLFCSVFENSPAVALAIPERGDLNGFASPALRLKVCSTTSLALLFDNRQQLLSMCLCLFFYSHFGHGINSDTPDEAYPPPYILNSVSVSILVSCLVFRQDLSTNP